MARRIIIHAGLPKTGSSAFQQACYGAREALARRGLHYDSDIHAPGDPKHTWVIRALRKPELLAGMGLARLAQAGDVLISTESITNELPLLTPQAGARFVAALSDFGRPEFVVVTRDADAWALSYYRQAVVNQPNNRMGFYATSLRFADFRRLPHVQMLADPAALGARMQAVFGQPARLVGYGPDLVRDLLAGWGAGDIALPAAAVNTSLGDEATEIMRQLNARIGGQADKRGWAAVMAEAGLAGGSAVLATLAARAEPGDLAALDPARIHALALTENPPLRPDPAAFDAARQAMADALARLQPG